jgi:hypothetical protein
MSYLRDSTTIDQRKSAYSEPSVVQFNEVSSIYRTEF